VNYGYDGTGMLTSMQGASAYVTSVTRDAYGAPTAVTYGNGTTWSNTYDPQRHWLMAASLANQTAKNLYQASYTYDQAGRMTLFQEGSRPTQSFYTYDDLNRLIQKSDGDSAHGDELFAYDPVGNITSSSALGSYIYSTSTCPSENTCAPHPHAVTKAGTNTYTYDENGNMISGGGRAMTFNADNLLTSVVVNGDVTQFDYDGDNALVSRTASGDQQPTYYFGPLVERAANGAMIYSYFMGSTLVARRSVSTTWYHADYLGSVRLLTDASGNAIAQYEYTPYGVTGTLQKPLDEFGFTGQRRNPSTAAPGQDAAGLIYMNARFYDATLGRFISPDTIIPGPDNPQFLNRYTYALNNPVSYNDPTGHKANLVLFDPEDPHRFNHRGGDPWATEAIAGMGVAQLVELTIAVNRFMGRASSLDGSIGTADGSGGASSSPSSVESAVASSAVASDSVTAQVVVASEAASNPSPNASQQADAGSVTPDAPTPPDSECNGQCEFEPEPDSTIIPDPKSWAQHQVEQDQRTTATQACLPGCMSSPVAKVIISAVTAYLRDYVPADSAAEKGVSTAVIQGSLTAVYDLMCIPLCAPLPSLPR
jgi:RHS repeat-associated protein